MFSAVSEYCSLITRHFNKCMAFNSSAWKAELVSQGELFIDLYDHLPKELIFQRELLAARLS